VILDGAENREPVHRHRSTFEKERGVTSVTVRGPYAFLSVGLDVDRTRHLGVYDTLAEAGVSINLVKLHEAGLSFVVSEEDLAGARKALRDADFAVAVTPSVSMVSVYAAGMRSMSGVMARIAGALLRASVPIVQTGDGPDTVFCLVESDLAGRAVEALRAEFAVQAEQAGIVVQKFGGRSVGTAESRALAAERVQEAIETGYRPVVVVSAIGRMGEPYATDTLLHHLDEVDPNTEPTARERDMLMACGEIISTVIMAQTLKARGLRTVALSGAQAGIITDYRYGDAQILEIRPDYIRQLLDSGEVDVVVVAGFQGVTEFGAVTTLGRGGSDTTASALAAALRAERVEIYTHVNGVMTADPETCPDARTLSMVTYEEVANMAHQGAKVLHPRAAEIAMLYQIPLWVKSSFERAPGTLVAPLAAIQPAVKRAVTGVATLGKLAYFTLTSLQADTRAEAEAQVYRSTGDAGIPFYLNSVGPQTSSFIVEETDARRVEAILDEMGLGYEISRPCEMVSVVALNMWEEAGFLRSIAQALQEAGVPMLQMADSECSVSCLVRAEDGARAVQALHQRFQLGG
jgi:aspartate kinase